MPNCTHLQCRNPANVTKILYFIPVTHSIPPPPSKDLVLFRKTPMKFRFALLLALCIGPMAFAQNGKVLDQVMFKLSDTARLNVEPNLRKLLDSVNFYRITYLSDGLKIKAFMAEPKTGNKLPCIIVNRNGNRDFQKWTESSIATTLGRYASWGYVVIASQYRGGGGSEGKDEFGGADLNDILNLVPVLGQVPKADTTRMGMQGTGRGGMMTFLALKRKCNLRGAVVISGFSDLTRNLAARPQVEANIYTETIPGYTSNKDKALKERSVVYWSDQLCKTTPLLVMHGGADWRVPVADVLELVNKLHDNRHPVRFILFEGGDQVLTEYKTEVHQQTRRHFNYYVRDKKKEPPLAPHGY